MPKHEERIKKVDIRKVEDGKEWKDFERYYTRKVRAIHVPPDLTARGILQINSEIDDIYSIARFDANHAKNKLEHLKERFSLAKKQATLHFKAIKGITVDDRDALIMTHLEVTPLTGMTEPITLLVDRWRERKLFMDAVIDTLLQKQGMMINGNGALKLDAQGRGDTGRKHRDDNDE